MSSTVDASSPRYRNPIIDADWPDPDAVRVGDDFYLVTSSFNRAPGLPVLHSRDLVNWRLLTHALPEVTPADHYGLPRHGGGVWAPSIRWHDGIFHIVYPDPDQGVFVVSATDPAGPWSEPRPLLRGLGIIDPCPLWDDDGRVFLVHGWAKSRSAVKNRLTVVEVDSALTRPLGPGRVVIDGERLPGYTTLEGPKFYKKDGWYWIFAPAGGVATGWQSVFRSRTVFGPYEDRIVLCQGDSPVNGPHQGAWIDTKGGEHWFLHFQDRGPIGRVVHLQPMTWREDGWPIIGQPGGHEWGTPVIRHHSPFGAVQAGRVLPGSDDFAEGLGMQWRWQANPEPGWASAGGGTLRLRGVANDAGNLRTLPQVLGQPIPGMRARFETSLSLRGPVGSRAGVTVLGRDYAWAGIVLTADGPRVVAGSRAEGDLDERWTHEVPLNGDVVAVRIIVTDKAQATIETRNMASPEWTVALRDFSVSAGQWIGAELALFAAAPLGASEPSQAAFDAVTLETCDGE